MPEISHGVDPSEEDAPDTTPESLSIEEGDHVFATGLFPPGPCSKSFRSVPLCSNDGIITSDNRLHIETSQSAYFCCDNRLHIEPHISAMMMVSSQVTIGCTSNPLNLRILAMTMVSSQVTIGHTLSPLNWHIFAMMMCLLHLKINRVPKTFNPCTLAPIPQWTLEHHPLSLNV